MLSNRFTLSLLTSEVPETAWILASMKRVNKTLVFFTRPNCSKNALSVQFRTVGLQTPLTNKYVRKTYN